MREGCDATLLVLRYRDHLAGVVKRFLRRTGGPSSSQPGNRTLVLQHQEIAAVMSVSRVGLEMDPSQASSGPLDFSPLKPRVEKADEPTQTSGLWSCERAGARRLKPLSDDSLERQ